MNDNTPEQTSPVPAEQSSSAATSKEPEKKTKAAPAPAPKASVSKTAVLSLVLSAASLAALGGAGWYGYKTVWPVLSQGTLANQSWVDSQLASNSRTITTQVANREAQISQQIGEVGAQSGRLVTRIDNLDRRLNRLQGADRNDWLLAEAEYLMRLANQRILTMHDLKSAQTLLAQADELLIAVDEYGLFNVRQALAEDMASIRGTADVDITGAWMELNAIANQIDQLPLISDTFASDAMALKPAAAPSEPVSSDTASPASETPAQAPQGIWQQVVVIAQGWGESLVELADEVTTTFAGQFHIRQSSAEDSPALMTPEQEVFLRQNLRLMIEQAQVALLQGRTAIYQASLVEVQQWLDSHFINNSQKMVAIKDALTRLSSVPVEQPVPDISRSLVALKGYVNDKVKQKLPVESVKASETQTGGEQ
ncbi:uroporphyrinogen-III C-methyltransferase [Parendozoicomonas haliclonae]|uniref:Putative uroporphyrinogen-III C-methyltransferase n=1 Tax=Parendozoicomonas haliclonae TaxID=1960125 RepID=A0A1X7AIV6_9GAMM|nr:uroporphyrinogen-III C-methyltransferase [Parendozoicomonas haliclonae]SMA45828.1 putative uroporphyrinogen-III C-methyltransferase [Parendozoicomonas haliclonae]